jgi:hypothetical protein
LAPVAAAVAGFVRFLVAFAGFGAGRAASGAFAAYTGFVLAKLFIAPLAAIVTGLIRTARSNATLIAGFAFAATRAVGARVPTRDPVAPLPLHGAGHNAVVSTLALARRAFARAAVVSANKGALFLLGHLPFLADHER